MGKLTFLAGVATGYVLGARAGKQRYAQIKTVSGKVWNSAPVQMQVATAKENAKTKAGPVVADLVAQAATATGEKLRASKTVPSEVASSRSAAPAGPTGDVWVDPPVTGAQPTSDRSPSPSHGVGGSAGGGAI